MVVFLLFIVGMYNGINISTNTSTILSTATATINSVTKVGDNYEIEIEIYNINNISRVGTSGYTAPTFTYRSTPIFNLHNSVLNEDVLIYNTAISTTVAAGASGNTTTGSIVHSDIVTITVSADWFAEANYEAFSVRISETVLIVDTSVSQVNTANSIDFSLLEVTTLYYNVVWSNDSNNFYDTRPEIYNLGIYLNDILEETIPIISSSNEWSGTFEILQLRL